MRSAARTCRGGPRSRRRTSDRIRRVPRLSRAEFGAARNPARTTMARTPATWPFDPPRFALWWRGTTAAPRQQAECGAIDTQNCVWSCALWCFGAVPAHGLLAPANPRCRRNAVVSRRRRGCSLSRTKAKPRTNNVHNHTHPQRIRCCVERLVGRTARARRCCTSASSAAPPPLCGQLRRRAGGGCRGRSLPRGCWALGAAPRSWLVARRGRLTAGAVLAAPPLLPRPRHTGQRSSSTRSKHEGRAWSQQCPISFRPRSTSTLWHSFCWTTATPR